MPDEISHDQELSIIEDATALIESTSQALKDAVQQLTPLANDNMQLREIVFKMEENNQARDAALTRLRAKINGEAPVPGEPVKPTDPVEPTADAEEEAGAETGPTPNPDAPTPPAPEDAAADEPVADLDQTNAEPVTDSGDDDTDAEEFEGHLPEGGAAKPRKSRNRH